MASVEEGIIMSANGLSSVNACSKFSYVKKTPNRVNAVIAYNNLFWGFFLYAEIDNDNNIRENAEPITYRITSTRSPIGTCWISEKTSSI